MIKVKTKNQTKATIHIFGIIGDDSWPDAEFWGITGPKKIIQDIQSVRNQVDVLEIKIVNSPGGEVEAGLAIYDLLNELKAEGITVNTSAVGEVGSISSVIYMVGETRSITDNASLFIHDVAGGVFGTAKQIENYLGIIEEDQQKILDIYIEITGLDESTVAEMMARESKINAGEAVTLGFATSKVSNDEKTIAFLSKIKSSNMAKPKVKLSFKERMAKLNSALTGKRETKNLELALTNGATGNVETEESEPQDGDILKIDDKPADAGEYVIQETNQKIVVDEKGVIASIESPEVDEDEGSEELEQLEEVVTNLVTQREKDMTELNEKFDHVVDVLEKIGKSTNSRFSPPKRQTRHDDADDGAGDDSDDKTKKTAIKNVLNRRKKVKKDEDDE